MAAAAKIEPPGACPWGAPSRNGYSGSGVVIVVPSCTVTLGHPAVPPVPHFQLTRWPHTRPGARVSMPLESTSYTLLCSGPSSGPSATAMAAVSAPETAPPAVAMSGFCRFTLSQCSVGGVQAVHPQPAPSHARGSSWVSTPPWQVLWLVGGGENSNRGGRA